MKTVTSVSQILDKALWKTAVTDLDIAFFRIIQNYRIPVEISKSCLLIHLYLRKSATLQRS